MSGSRRSAVLAPGDDFGPFRIVQRLGQGGMGTVYEAFDTALARHVALKLIVADHAADPEFRTRFVREAQLQASLDSPHVVQVFAHGEVDDHLYIATQLVLDGDLGSELRRHGPLVAADAVELVLQVADGLVEAHRVGLVHRDIKASNVLLRRRGTHTDAYLADFGIADRTTRDDATQVADDVHALGRLLWSCLTALPYDDSWLPDAPRPVDRVLRRALAGDYQTARQLAGDLRQAQRSRAERPRQRLPVGVMGGLTAAVGAGAAAIILLPWSGPSQESGPAQPGDPPADLVHRLQRDAGLDPASATCAARAVEVDDLTGVAACLWSD